MEPPTPQQKKKDELLALPSPEKLREIARRQDERALEMRAKRQRASTIDERTNAAQIIQRHYRGHQTRRELKGYALDPSTRWLEVCSTTTSLLWPRMIDSEC